MWAVYAVSRRHKIPCLSRHLTDLPFLQVYQLGLGRHYVLLGLDGMRNFSHVRTSRLSLEPDRLKEESGFKKIFG